MRHRLLLPALSFFCAMLGFFGWILPSLAGRTPAARVEMGDNKLIVDGKAAPYIYGAEIQYFRARGGPEDRGLGDSEAGRNVPAAEVEALWKKLLDRAREAGMNAVTFYIPWDFHEVSPGVFDFDGTLDQDGDGKPDYPSRNVKKFLAMVEAEGFRYVMVRPGPYINAEWGPTGFGAVPKWFLENPLNKDALAKRPAEYFATTPEEAAAEAAKLPRVATFHHLRYQNAVRAWFKALHDKVLADAFQPGKPAVMLQLDNETNYFWSSLYERDWSAVSLERYRKFIHEKYRDTPSLQTVYGDGVGEIEKVLPPRSPQDSRLGGPAWHQDWLRFHEVEVREYHRWLRTTWESLGVREPNVLFTTCDSYNALDHGMVPRLDDRQNGRLSLSTMNIYPKTFGDTALSTLNVPMKAAFDAAVFSASHAGNYGAAGNWLMVTETMGGWFPPTEVSLNARQHTYGSLLGTNVKALIVYYFHEGWNWTGLDGKDLKEADLLAALRKYDIGIMKGAELKFDAPLDRFGNPRPTKEGKSSFAILKSLGKALAAGLGDALMTSQTVTAPILLLQDHEAQSTLPNHQKGIEEATTYAAATFGWLREGGYLPEVRFLDGISDEALQKYRVVISRPRKDPNAKDLERLKKYVEAGGRIWWLGPRAPQVLADLGAPRVQTFANDPASGWNGDDYAKLPTAEESLALLRRKMGEADVEPVVAVSAPDGKPFAHAWLRRVNAERWLLFVENFQRGTSARTLRVNFGPAAELPDRWKISPRWLASDSTSEVAKSRPVVEYFGDHRVGGISLGASADGVDVWEISAE